MTCILFLTSHFSTFLTKLFHPFTKFCNQISCKSRKLPSKSTNKKKFRQGRKVCANEQSTKLCKIPFQSGQSYLQVVHNPICEPVIYNSACFMQGCALELIYCFFFRNAYSYCYSFEFYSSNLWSAPTLCPSLTLTTRGDGIMCAYLTVQMSQMMGDKSVSAEIKKRHMEMCFSYTR